MIVIDQGGKRVRQRCGYCHSFRFVGHYARPRQRNQNNRNWLCNECFAETIDEAIRKHQEQIEDGISFELRYFEMPADMFQFIDDYWVEVLRMRFSEPEPTAVEKLAKKGMGWFAEAMELITRNAT
jgi:hypothetical protein